MEGGRAGVPVFLSLFTFFTSALLRAVFIGMGGRLKKKKKGLLSANDVITNNETQLSNPFLKTFGSHSGEDVIAWRFSRC